MPPPTSLSCHGRWSVLRATTVLGASHTAVHRGPTKADCGKPPSPAAPSVQRVTSAVGRMGVARHTGVSGCSSLVAVLCDECDVSLQSLPLPPPHSVPGGNTSTPTPCGDAQLYCPGGSSGPSPVGPGYFSTGVSGAKTGRSPCPRGQYCDGTGTPIDCPLGRYGAVEGMEASLCSGQCSDGIECLPRSTSDDVLCPEGSVCIVGVPVPCPSGRYNPVKGASNASLACIPCPANTFNPLNGSALLGACTSCASFEESSPGASMCWPGVRGESMIF